MSAFDVLAYPLDDFPTHEQLDRIPQEIYNRWEHLIAKVPPSRQIKAQIPLLRLIIKRWNSELI